MKIRLFLASALIMVTVSPAYADMIEVKGRGFVSGTVVSESSEEIVFKDGYGHIQNFPRSEVVYIEKEKPHAAKGFLLPSVKRSLHSAKETASTVKKGFSTLGSDGGSSGGFDRWLDQSVGMADRITVGIERISQSWLDFLFRGEDAGQLTRSIQTKVTTIRDYKSQNFLVGGIGMALMFFGMLALVIFGFRLIAEAFEQHFLWGAAFLAIPLSYAAPLIGASAGLIAMVPYFASLCFIILYWRSARPMFVAQIFCGNVILFGFFLLQLAS